MAFTPHRCQIVTAALFPATDGRYAYGTKVQWIGVAALVNLAADGKAIEKGWLEQ